MTLFISTVTNEILLFTFSDKLIQSEVHVGSNDHSFKLYGLLEKFDLSLVERIILVNGPGSFTGMRVGAIFARTLAMEKNIEIATIDYISAIESYSSEPVFLKAGAKKYYTKVDGELIVTNDMEPDEINPSLDIEKFINSNLELTYTSYKEVELNYVKKAF